MSSSRRGRFTNIKCRISRLRCPLWMLQKGRPLRNSSLASDARSKPYKRQPAKTYNTWNQLSYRTRYQTTARIAASCPGQRHGSAFLTSASRTTLAYSRLRARLSSPYRHSFRPSTPRPPVNATCNRQFARLIGEETGVVSTSRSYGVS